MVTLPEGISLLIDGETVLVQGNGQALVKSRSVADTDYNVERDDETGRWTCTCKGYEIRRRCRHSRAIERWHNGEADVRFREDVDDENS